MGCGVCVSQCPNDALSLTRDERKGIPLDVKALQSHFPISDLRIPISTSTS